MKFPEYLNFNTEFYAQPLQNQASFVYTRIFNDLT